MLPQKQIPAEGWPLVLALHGAGGSSENFLQSTGWSEMAEKEGIVMLFPNGTPLNESKPANFFMNP